MDISAGDWKKVGKWNEMMGWAWRGFNMRRGAFWNVGFKDFKLIREWLGRWEVYKKSCNCGSQPRPIKKLWLVDKHLWLATGGSRRKSPVNKTRMPGMFHVTYATCAKWAMCLLRKTSPLQFQPSLQSALLLSNYLEQYIPPHMSSEVPRFFHNNTPLSVSADLSRKRRGFNTERACDGCRWRKCKVSFYSPSL